MLSFHRVEQLLAPSVPRRLRTQAAAATQTPVPMPQGEGSGGAGKSEGGDGLLPSGLSPLSGAPSVETDLRWMPHPSHSHLFDDEHLAVLLTQWGATS